MTEAGQDTPSSQGRWSGAGALLLGLSLSILFAACSSGDPGVSRVGVELSPAAVVLLPGGAQQFSAIGLMSDGSTGSVGVTWSATGGTISSGGMYSAGTVEGSYRVIATADDGSFADTAAVTVSVPPPNLVAVELTPPAAVLQSGGTQQFTAIGRLSNGSTTTIPINWTATGGTVSPSGLYTAGSTVGAFRVIASSAGGEFADTSAITIQPHLTGVEVTPTSASLAPAAAQHFSVIGRMSDGSTQAVSVNWTATGGSITAAGDYTAGTTDGDWRVIATTLDGELADTAEVTITTPPPDLVAIEISPDSARLTVSATQPFTAIGRLSDGNTTPVTVTWSIETSPAPNPVQNSVSAAGLVRAGSPIGRYLLSASNGSLSANVPVIVHSTTGFTLPPGPAFWTPVAGTVRLCTSNHYNDDGTRGGIATVTATGGDVVSPSVPFTTDPTPQTYSDGTGEVRVLCQTVWTAPLGMVGDAKVYISVAPTRPGTGIAKVFVYARPECMYTSGPDPCGRASYSTVRDFNPPNFTTAAVVDSAVVSATLGANIWFKPTYVP